ncbi:MAG: phosphoribosylaminoimidazolesuccinocarboxamide synthase [Geodermatophilaceae bacterium]|nr:phosphoribosylaminoimidazolesuccinocarboxamide synthase [Geodermatophilaceae bacterium]
MRLLASGKVREIYELAGDELLLVASDRISAYDVVMPTPIPDKGAVLTAMSAWWFSSLRAAAPHHVVSVSDGVPAEFRGRAMVVRRLAMVPVECVARGYLAGSGVTEYEATGSVCGVRLPPGLLEGDRLPEPIFTPATKAAAGDHDENVAFDAVVAAVGGPQAERLRSRTLSLYAEASRRAESVGILLADTKFEFGVDAAGELVLGDEVLTPDSSRFWPADSWAPGGSQPSYDKQYVRDWLVGESGWNRTPPGPELPADVVAATRARYVQAYERLTGCTFPPRETPPDS